MTKLTAKQRADSIQQWAERMADYLLGLDQDRSHKVLATREHRLAQSGATKRSKSRA